MADITTSKHAETSWVIIITFALAVSSMTYFGLIAPDIILTKCGVKNQYADNIVRFSLSSVIASYFLMVITLSKVSWTEEFITYRAWNLKKYTVPVSSIRDYDTILTWQVVKFKSSPCLLYMPFSDRHFEFDHFIYRSRLITHPHEFYFPAERQVLYDGAECGCMGCLSVFSKDEVDEWVGERKDKAFSKDRAVCPVCNQWENVVTNQAKVKMTTAELILATKKQGLEIGSSLIKKKVQSSFIQNDKSSHIGSVTKLSSLVKSRLKRFQFSSD